MNTDKSKYLVGELAEYFGVSNDTLRLYDKKGICSPQKNEMNHYRTYSREDFILLEFVMRLKQMGMTLDEIKLMVTDCSVEKAEAIMSIEAKKLEDQIKKLQILKDMVQDYRKSYAKVIEHFGRYEITESPTFLYLDVHDSMPENMKIFKSLSQSYLPKFTFVMSKEDFLREETWEKMNESEYRRTHQKYALTMIDDENFGETENFPHHALQIKKYEKCVHTATEAYTNSDYSGFKKCSDYLRDNHLTLAEDPLLRMIYIGGDKGRNHVYYEFWMPIE